MNRKNINDLIKMLVPVPSTIIGAPRKSSAMREYLKCNPAGGIIEFEDDLDCSQAEVALPDFFKPFEVFLKYSAFIARLNSCRVWGGNGAVIAAGDYLISDVAREFNKGLNIEHSIFYTIKQIKASLLKGNAAIIGTAGANVYYHWMLDILPRLGLISKMIPLSSIDHFITGFNCLPFQNETLEKLGIGVEKIIASNDNWNFHIKAETLFVPSLAGPLDQPDFYQVDFLRNLYKDSISDKQSFRKIYISRKKVGRREIINEDELITYLSKYHFEIVHCEEMKVAEQVNLFSEASVIICSHGSALTNLVFCKPHTIVIDIFNPSHINPCFWFISNILDLEYHFILGESKSFDNNSKNDHTIVDIILFVNTLQKIGLE